MKKNLLTQNIKWALGALTMALALCGCDLASDTDSETRLKEEQPPFSQTPLMEHLQFASQESLYLSDWVTSNDVTVYGLGTGVKIPVTIVGGEYSINGGEFTSAPGLVKSWDRIQVRQLSADDYNTSTSATLTLGEAGQYSSTFMVTTSVRTTAVERFAFTDALELDPAEKESGAEVMSDSITPTGFNVPVMATVEGGKLSVDGGEYIESGESVLIQPQQSLQLIVTHPSDFEMTQLVVLQLGNENTSWTVSTRKRAFADSRPFYGVNFNGQMQDYSYPNDPAYAIDPAGTVMATVQSVDDLDTKWVRGFINMFSLKNGNTDVVASVAAINELKQNGHKVALNLKWDFSTQTTTYDDGNGGTQPFPLPGSPEMQIFLDDTKSLLDTVWNSVDLIVVGNEPFIEVPAEYAGGGNAPGLAAFYKTLADYVKAYRAGTNSTAPIFVGSFNQLESTDFRHEQSMMLLEYARDTDGIAGVDVHIHHDEYSDVTEVMDYVTQDIGLGEEKYIISTEFSFMKFWKSKNGNDLDETFKTNYSLTETKVHEYLNSLVQIGGSTTRTQWLDFVDSQDWYKNNQVDYLSKTYDIFTDYPQFKAGFYALRQTIGTTYESNHAPWILNGIYVNRTVELLPDGTPQLNASYKADFDKYKCSNSDTDC